MIIHRSSFPCSAWECIPKLNKAVSLIKYGFSRMIEGTRVTDMSMETQP